MKYLYGRRATPGVKIFMLIVVIFLGLHLVFSQAGQSDTTHAPINTSIDIEPLNANYSDLVTPSDTSAAEELQKLLPHSKVVKAFNTTFAADFTSPIIDGQISDAFIAANNGNALETVSNIVAAAGFNPVVAGDLSVSRTLERMLLTQIQIGLRNR